MSNSSIWSIDRILIDATTPSQSGAGRDGNKKSTLHSPKLQDRNLSIRLLSVTPEHSLRDAVGLF